MRGVDGATGTRIVLMRSFELGGREPRTLLVSRGVGCSSVPARLFAAPEVHLCLIT